MRRPNRSESQITLERFISLNPPTTTSRLLGLLFAHSKGYKHITEIGVSNPHTTYAFLNALDGTPGGRLVSIDILNEYPEAIEAVKRSAEETGVSFEFRVGSSIEIEIEPTEFLFIDSLHERRHLLTELDLHSGRVSPDGMIAFHDTEAPCDLFPVVMEWLESTRGRDWRIVRHYHLSHGLTLIERKKAS